ncbi:hypothetical protein LINPERPRIM_LOCUS28978 [Linum perenne]
MQVPTMTTPETDNIEATSGLRRRWGCKFRRRIHRRSRI